MHLVSLRLAGDTRALASLELPWRPTRRRRLLVLLPILIAAGTFRLGSLDAYGFSEDEIAKLRAIDAYERGDYSANAEHPMLMKLAVWASVRGAERLNEALPAPGIPPETALRLPNALAGTATVGVVYGVAAALFGGVAGLIAAALVALDPTITSINRIGKEDTFLVLFFLVAVYCYERAKRVGATSPPRAQPWYHAAGAAFGLAFASKYILHLFGLYALFNLLTDRHPGANRPRALTYNGLMVATFLAANAAILLPATWEYCRQYLSGAHSIHHGYMYDGELYVNSAGVLLHGVPATYYLHLFGTKLPLPILGAALAGVVALVIRRRERGYVWLRILLWVQLLGYSAVAAKFLRYALPMLMLIDILAAVGLVLALEWIWRRGWGKEARVAASATLCLAALAGTGAAQAGAAPFYSAYQNAIGAALAPPATVFPEEAYDYGVREAVAAVSHAARPGAAIVSDASLVVEHYLRSTGRTDIDVRSLSADGLGRGTEQWVLIQDGHIYFENESMVAQIRQRHTPWREYRLRGTVVLQVFRIEG